MSRAAPKGLGVAAVSVLAYALCDLLHELGHAAATLLPLGVRAVSISTIGLSSEGSSAVVAAAGSLVNGMLAFSLLAAGVRSLPPSWRYFSWLFGTVNLFNAAAYLLYSAVIGSGDWAVVFDGAASPMVWRPLLGLAGAAAYATSVYAASHVLRRLASSGVIAESNIRRDLAISYWVGGALLTLGAVFNPVSPWFILTSGAATGFGAMVGLLLLPIGSQRSVRLDDSTVESLRLGWGWVAAGAVAAVLFIGVLGPGIVL